MRNDLAVVRRESVTRFLVHHGEKEKEVFLPGIWSEERIIKSGAELIPGTAEHGQLTHSLEMARFKRLATQKFTKKEKTNKNKQNENEVN